MPRQKEKTPLTEEEQAAFVDGTALRRNDAKAAVLLAMLHGGMMPTEVAATNWRGLLKTPWCSQGTLPYLAHQGEKQKAGQPRRRLSTSRARRGITEGQAVYAEGVEWLNSEIDPSTPSANPEQAPPNSH